MVARHGGLNHARAARVCASRHGKERMARMVTRDGEGNTERIRRQGDPTFRRVSRDGVTNDASKFLLVHQSWSA